VEPARAAPRRDAALGSNAPDAPIVRGYLNALTRCLFLVALVWLFSGCAASTPSQNVDALRREISSRIRVVAQAPMILPGGMGAEKAQAIHAAFQQLMADALEQRGFTVIPARQTYQISDRLIRDLGGAFDPRKDLEKFRVYRDSLRHEIRETVGVDAIVSAEIVPVTATYSSATARWDSAAQNAVTGGLGVAELLFGANAGTVPALSLLVSMEDAVSGERMWSGLSGVHVLSKREANKWVPIPVEKALSDQTRNRNAVRIVFRSLVRLARDE
jgi:hypothetical protein